MDGFDEYQDGRHASIIAAIQKDTFPNACIVVASRETEKVKHLRAYMDAEVEILGIDMGDVSKYIRNSLRDNARIINVLKQTNEWVLCGMIRMEYDDDYYHPQT